MANYRGPMGAAVSQKLGAATGFTASRDVVPFLDNFNTTVNWNSQPASDSEIFATTSHGCKHVLDLSPYTQFRWTTVFGGTGNSGARLYPKASVGATGVHKLQDISDTATSGDVTYSASSLVSGSWVSIDPAYRVPNVLVTVYGTGGNAATALALRMMQLEVR